MSDFLANFNKENYNSSEKKARPAKKKAGKESSPALAASTEPVEAGEEISDFDLTDLSGDEVDELMNSLADVSGDVDLSDEEMDRLLEKQARKLRSNRQGAPKGEKAPKKPSKSKPVVAAAAVPQASTTSKNSRSQDEETEFDPTYKKKQLRKRGLIGGLLVLAAVALFFAYYQMNHVTLPDFVGKELAEARTWFSDNDLKLEVQQEYDETVAANQVMAQSKTADKKIKKGSTVQLTASKGPDPDQVLALPDFLTMSKTAAEEWKSANQAENISLIDEYSDNEEAGKALRVEFNNKDVTRETYRRKEKVKIYYSKGKETFEKNITVSDFVNKPKTEVESWAKTNDIKVTYQEESSDSVAADNVISQSIAKDEKVAKKDEMTVVVSTGKAFVVPHFGYLTPEEAAGAAEGLAVQVKSVFSETVGYGQLISQSIPAGSQLTSKDDLSIQVIYSLGKPYIKDIRGTMTEGDLPKYFYDEFQAKGADITYEVRYVNSAESKGLVIGSSAVNQYLPMQQKVYVDVSRGNLQGEQQYSGGGLAE